MDYKDIIGLTNSIRLDNQIREKLAKQLQVDEIDIEQEVHAIPKVNIVRQKWSEVARYAVGRQIISFMKP